MSFLHERCEKKDSAYHAMKDSGCRFHFGEITREEVRALGHGCGYDVFGLPEFDDIYAPKYRDHMTDENRAKIHDVNKMLGLKKGAYMARLLLK